jgi:hypothetical protein
VSFPFLPFGDFRSPFLVFFLERFRGLSLWDFVGDVCFNPSWFFPFDSPPKFVRKGARFWGFLGSRVRGVLGGISSIPLILASFGGPNLGYGVPKRCSYYPPKSCAKPWSNSGDQELDLRELTSKRCSSRGLRSHRPDRCLSSV